MIDSKQERNPLTHQRHRKEVLWQIIIPVVIGGLILLVISVLSALMIPVETSRWADISLIWLIVPAMGLILISLAMLIASIYAVIKIIQVLPVFTFRVQNGLILVRSYIRTAGNRSIEPILRYNSISAGLRRLLRQVNRR